LRRPLLISRQSVIALDDVFVDGDRERVAPDLPGRGPAFEVALGEKRFDGAWEGFALPFLEADFLAVGHLELLGVGLPCASAARSG